jgi:hypothetical protein
MSPYQHGIRRSATAQGAQAEVLLAFLGLLVKPAIQLDALFPALDGHGREALPGLPCKVSTNGVSSIPTLELKGNSVECIHHPWICISKAQVGHGVCKTPELLVQGMACHQGGTLPHRE